ncbi:glutamine amidotransferase-related protein [Branchiibius cervicis]|uniref:Gamma-glutamyl-gamma-aminobutyrate hydrolase family protein n=1 Tax=Branchiibius cervicis TaxID=908252 RepID=A0ABW2AQJ9_9MICO
MRLALIENDPDSGPGRLMAWCPTATVVHAHAGESLPAATDFDGFVLLGGGFMPDADDLAPWLPAERALIEAAVDSQTPLLGICLGAQLLAYTCGGQVTPAYGLPEKGSRSCGSVPPRPVIRFSRNCPGRYGPSRVIGTRSPRCRRERPG